MPPVLSIITVNRNNASGLKATIDSVVSQNISEWQKIEYIIIDGNSTDDSVEIIKSFISNPKTQNKISFWSSEPDTGIYNGMNKGIKKAHGKYCLFLNSGDTLNKDSILEYILQITQTEKDFYYSNYYFFKDGKNNLVSLPKQIDETYFLSNTINHQNCLIKKQLFKTIGLYDETYRILADWDFYIKAFYKFNCSFEYCSEIFSNYESTGVSSTSTQSEKYWNERKLLVTKNFPDCPALIDHYMKMEEEYKQSIWYEIKTKWGISGFLIFCMKVYRFFVRRICKEK